jgi:hypothetical protein
MIGPIYIPKFGSYKVRTPLNWVPGAIHGVSVDKLLRQEWGGPVAQLRNTANNAEARFRWSDWIDGTAEGFAANSTLVGAFDQTGNGRHWNQGTTSAQPVMVSSGAFSTYFDGKAIGADFQSGSTHWMGVNRTQGLLPTLTGGFTLVVKVSPAMGSSGTPPIFGNMRGVQSYNPGSFGITSNGQLRNELDGTTFGGVTTNATGTRVIVGVLTDGLFTRYYSASGGAIATATSSTAWVNTATNSNLRLMIGTGAPGTVDTDRRVFGQLSTTLIYPRPLTATEAATLTELLW